MAAAPPASTTLDLFSSDLLPRLQRDFSAQLQALDRKAARSALNQAQQALNQAFKSGAPVQDLVLCRAQLVDGLLISAWNQQLAGASEQAALVAVGGYGRAELHPHSDIDVLILIQSELQSQVERFIAFLWDTGLQIGHSVRSPEDCREQARDDLTVMTNMLEARLLTGDEGLYATMQNLLTPEQVWDSEVFFKGKLAEQAERHRYQQDSGYRLEPNVKETPGGLRDLQTLEWIARRHYRIEGLQGLVAEGLLSAQEHAEMINCRNFLWRVRFALHLLTGRSEDRLLFDHQIAVAQMFGHQDRSNNLAVEQFMQRYYRNIKALSAGRDVLMQSFREVILHEEQKDKPRILNARFQVRKDAIETRHTEVFRDNPWALLELFLLLQQDEGLQAIRAGTLREIRRARHLIDEDLRADVKARRLFMEILRQPQGVTRALRQMNRYGILGRYLPVFGRIIGRMQYDLFHTLTVDEHILFVIRNLRRLRMPRFDDELPYASEVMQGLDRPELLYIAALFHDIAKGRGGDHSELGAADARDFCHAHGISSEDTELIIWLVEQHLLMSMTAQRQDIADPKIIRAFVAEVGNQRRLDYLFLLTICDIRATNPELWNSWRESLLLELYSAASKSLVRGAPIEESELIEDTRRQARELLESALDEEEIDAVWARLDDDYFLRINPDELAWQTLAIARSKAVDIGEPLVLVEPIDKETTTVFIYTEDVDYLFGLTTGILSQLGLNVLDARIGSTNDGYTLDSYVVAEADGKPVHESQRYLEIEHALQQAIANPQVSDIEVTRRASRRTRHFSTPTQIHFASDTAKNRTIMDLVTADRPGLLSMVGKVFRKRRILVETAKIGTMGERAEDVFFITDIDHQPITNPQALAELREVLTRLLDRPERPE